MVLPVTYARMTSLARHLTARAQLEGIGLGDWSYQVGTGGYNLLSPLEALPIDPTEQTLSASVGGDRALGRVLVSGIGASIVPSVNPGFCDVTGLTAVPSLVTTRWLRLSGSADPNINGTWRIGVRTSASAVMIENPLVSISDLGPLNWEIREACVLLPNGRAPDFQARVVGTDPIDDIEIGQVGVFCRVLRSPADPLLIGTPLLYARANHPPKIKTSDSAVTWHLCVQH